MGLWPWDYAHEAPTGVIILVRHHRGLKEHHEEKHRAMPNMETHSGVTAGINGHADLGILIPL